MFASVILAAFASSVIVSAAPVAQRDLPTTWASGYLEDYDTYHTRYLALGCKEKHDTTFFDDCCHPLLATENLVGDRGSHCTPNAIAASSASAYTHTATATASADADAETEYSEATASVVSVYISATSAAAKAKETVADAVGDYAEAKSTKAPDATTTSKPAETSKASGGGGGGSGQTFYGGFATFFYQNGNPGECGSYHSDSDYIIAIDVNGHWQDWQTNSNSPKCGRSIEITNPANGKTVVAVVADACPTCVSDNSLDLSVAAFNAIAEPSQGSVAIEWKWV